jgi:hypothetical protein
MFCAETINSDRYVKLILTEFFTQLTEEERLFTWFQQDSATAHGVVNSLAALEGMFDDRIVSGSLSPARSPDISPCDFHLWSDLKDKLNRTNPHIEVELKGRISSGEFEPIKRYSVRVRVQGQHYQHFLHRG